jgi:hypothetical protein
MAFQVSPGINVSEIDLTTIVPAVATSLGGIAGAYEWGPAKKVTLVDSPKMYRDTFGAPEHWNFAQWYSGQNYLAYSNSLQVVRVVDKDAKNSAMTGAGNYAPRLYNNEDEFDASNGIFAKYPGNIGNTLEVSIFPGPGTEPGIKISLAEYFEDVAEDFALNLRGATAYIFDDGSVKSDSEGAAATGIVVNYNVGTQEVFIKNPTGDWPTGIITGSTASLNILGQGLTLNAVILNATSGGITTSVVSEFINWEYAGVFGVDGEGAPEDTESMRRNEGGATTNDQIHFVVVDRLGQITGVRNTVLEKFANVSVLPDARTEDGTVIFYKNYINERSKYIHIGGPDIPVSPTSDFTSLFNIPFTLTGQDEKVVNWGKVGSNGTTVYALGGTAWSFTGGTGERTTRFVDAVVPSPAPIGYNLFEDVEGVNVSLLISGAITDSVSVQSIKNIAELRKDCIAFFSADNKNENASEATKLSNCETMKSRVGSSSYAVIDSGYKYQYDPFNDVYRWVPLNGDIAGLCARTDFTNDPWFSPAGYNRGQIRNVIKLAFNPSKTFRDQLYPQGINPVITELGEGTILLGDRTALSKPSAFDRINVRRLFIVLQKAITQASKFSLFEFNDNFTRGQFTALVTPFLADVRSRRGIIDYKVVCDTSNNTPERIDRNEFHADIYIKPNRSINFIQLNFIATRTGGDFTVIGA